MTMAAILQPCLERTGNRDPVVALKHNPSVLPIETEPVFSVLARLSDADVKRLVEISYGSAYEFPRLPFLLRAAVAVL